MEQYDTWNDNDNGGNDDEEEVHNGMEKGPDFGVCCFCCTQHILRRKKIKQRRQKRILRWENDKRMKKRTRAQDNILCWYYFSVDPHHTISFIFQRYFNLEINNDNDNHDVLVEFCRSFGFVPPHKLRLFKMIKSKSKSPSWKYQRHTHEPTNISFGVLHPLMPSLPTFIF